MDNLMSINTNNQAGNSDANNQSSHSGSYFMKFLKVSSEVMEFTNNITNGMGDSEKKFMVQLIASTIINTAKMEPNEYIPIPSKTIEKYARGANPLSDKFNDIIELINADQQRRRCRRFRLVSDKRDALLEAMTISNIGQRRCFNLITSKPTTRINRSKYKTSDDKLEPVLIRKAMYNICPRPYNAQAIEAHLYQEKQQYEDMKSNYGEDDRRTVRQLARYLNDLRCYHVVLNAESRVIMYRKGAILYSWPEMSFLC
ncbi:MAG: hypothetical protein HQL64_15190 [Magnetococcales bacterium]|nr:hypothetical protein [Magnetococcales bacterium]